MVSNFLRHEFSLIFLGEKNYSENMLQVWVSLKSSDHLWPAAHKRPVRLPGRASSTLTGQGNTLRDQGTTPL